MCALYAHFDESQSSGSGGTISLTPPVSSLIQSCVDSAQTILGTLRVLGDDDSLGMLNISCSKLRTPADLMSRSVFAVSAGGRLLVRLSAPSNPHN